MHLSRLGLLDALVSALLILLIAMLITTHRRLVWRWVCTWFASIAAHAFLMIFFLTRNVRGAGLAHRWMRVWPARPTSLGGVRYGVHCPR